MHFTVVTIFNKCNFFFFIILIQNNMLYHCWSVFYNAVSCKAGLFTVMENMN